MAIFNRIKVILVRNQHTIKDNLNYGLECSKYMKDNASSNLIKVQMDILKNLLVCPNVTRIALRKNIDGVYKDGKYALTHLHKVHLLKRIEGVKECNESFTLNH